jgi:hypothetical protein
LASEGFEIAESRAQSKDFGIVEEAPPQIGLNGQR